MATKEEILNTFTSKDAAWYAYREGLQYGYNEAIHSLRNQAAIAAMQAIIPGNNDRYMGFDAKVKYRKAAFEAVGYADALIAQLMKKED